MFSKMELSAAFLFMLTWHLILFGNNAEAKGYVTFKFVNNCNFPVWPAIAPSAGFPVIADGGFFLHCDKDQTKEVQIPSDWCGRFWGRTGCKSTSESECSCQTGDCAGKKACNGTSGRPPATLVEVSLQKGAPCGYGISIVDGYNLNISISSRPKNSSCSIDGCVNDLIGGGCPKALKVLDQNGNVIACMSACLRYQDEQTCCTGKYNSPETCSPTAFSMIFKKACPSYISFAHQTPSPLRWCEAKKYVVTFCPAKPSGRAFI